MRRLAHLRRILALMVFVLGCVASAEAQVDCYYGYKIYVRDEAGKVIGNGDFKVTALKGPWPQNAKYYIDDNAIYHIMGVMNTTIRGDFRLMVSAPGFEPFERTFNFPVCETQWFELRLQPKGSSVMAHYQRLNTLRGQVFDEEKKPVVDVKVEVKSGDGRVYQTLTNFSGYYDLGVPEGVADIRISGRGFSDIVFNNHKVADVSTVLDVPVCLKCVRQ